MGLYLFFLPLFLGSFAAEGFVLRRGSASAMTTKGTQHHKQTSGALKTNDYQEHPQQQHEWDAQRYQDQHSFVWEYGTSLVDLLKPQPGERILDIGCGTGELTHAIAHYNDGDDSGDTTTENIIGMDSDLNMIQKAQEQFPGIPFVQADVRDFQVERVDAIFSNAALHWVPPADVERSVISMAQSLKLGGRFVVEFGGKRNVQQIVEVTLETIPNAKCPWYFPSISEYTTILERNGIEVLVASLVDRPTPLQDGASGVKNWLRMFGHSFFEGKTNDEIEEALDAIHQKLSQRSNHRKSDSSSGGLHFDGEQWIADYRRIRIVGKKISE